MAGLDLIKDEILYFQHRNMSGVFVLVATNFGFSSIVMMDKR